MRRLLLLAPLSVVLLAGCGGGGESAPSVSPSVSAPASVSSSPSASVSTSPSASVAAGTKVGEPNKDSEFTATVEEVAQDQAFDGKNYAAALVKYCVGVMPPQYQDMAFGWQSWAVVGADGSRYPSKFVSDGIPQSPKFPQSEVDGVFLAGECARGWITFDVPAGVQVAKVRHDVGGTQPWMWSVG